MADRIFEPKINAVGGILLPAGAGAGKVAVSDASGNFSWATTGPKKKYRTAYTWVWRRAEKVVAETVDGPYISLGESETQTLVRVDYRLAAGKVTLKIAKANGTVIEPFTAMVANATEPKSTTGTTALSAGEELALVLTTIEAAEGLRVTITIEHEA
jgi:hypothetical protein